MNNPDKIKAAMRAKIDLLSAEITADSVRDQLSRIDGISAVNVRLHINDDPLPVYIETDLVVDLLRIQLSRVLHELDRARDILNAASDGI